jgi:hypothetical protein
MEATKGAMEPPERIGVSVSWTVVAPLVQQLLGPRPANIRYDPRRVTTTKLAGPKDCEVAAAMENNAATSNESAESTHLHPRREPPEPAVQIWEKYDIQHRPPRT